MVKLSRPSLMDVHFITSGSSDIHRQLSCLPHWVQQLTIKQVFSHSVVNWWNTLLINSAYELLMYYIDRQFSLWVHETTPAFQTWRSQSSFSVNLPWTVCGFVCNVNMYKKYWCKSPCKGKSYETICANIVSRYQTLVSSLPRGTVFLHRRSKTEFITGQP